MNAPELIWGLQRLKELLPEDAKEDFFTLECELLDTLHRQKIANLSEQFVRKQTALLAQCDQLAQVHSQRRFTDLCVPALVLPTAAPRASTQATPNMNTASPSINDFYYMTNVQLLTKHVPVAYCFQKKAQEYPLVTVTIDATKMELPCLASIIVAFASYGESVKSTLPIEPGQKTSRDFLPTLTVDDLKRLREHCPVKLYIDIEFVTAQQVPIPYHKTEDIYFYPRSVAVLWSIKEDGTLLNCTDGLAGWVTPRLPKIETLHRKAADYHHEGELWGYHSERTKKAQKHAVREQVRALFQALHQDMKLAYATSSNVVRPQTDQMHYILQNVRLPVDIFNAGGPANCLDGSLLFASLLEKANLQPLLLLHQGHAVVGWRVYPEKQIYEFLEATSIHKGDFELACQQGWVVYHRAYPKGVAAASASDIPNSPLLVDIVACRKRNIVPMDL